jgi:myosin heavy subunit
MLRLIKEPILLAFLIVSYNFALVQLSHMLDVRLYPSSLSEKLHLTFFLSALYVAWLFGERLRTVAWIGLLFVFNVLLQATMEQRFSLVLEQMPAFLITLLVIKLFESPVEKRWRQFQEEKHRLEEELSKNQKELMEALKTKRLHQELIEKLTKEKSELEKRIERLTGEETAEKERLLKEKEDIVKRLNSFKEILKGYEERIERLTEANRRLFEMLELQQERTTDKGDRELSKLRSERKKLMKELLALEELLEESSKENLRLNEERENLRHQVEELQRELSLSQLRLEEYERIKNTKKELYQEMLELVFDRIEWEDQALEEFVQLDHQRKREFLKELMLLNMKELGEVFETLKGVKNTFKLKPKGGRIYFTYGKEKTWRILGILDEEDQKHKERFIRELAKWKE